MTENGLALLTYDSGIKFTFQGQQEDANRLKLAKIIVCAAVDDSLHERPFEVRLEQGIALLGGADLAEDGVAAE